MNSVETPGFNVRQQFPRAGRKMWHFDLFTQHDCTSINYKLTLYYYNLNLHNVQIVRSMTRIAFGETTFLPTSSLHSIYVSSLIDLNVKHFLLGTYRCYYIKENPSNSEFIVFILRNINLCL